ARTRPARTRSTSRLEIQPTVIPRERMGTESGGWVTPGARWMIFGGPSGPKPPAREGYSVVSDVDSPAAGGAGSTGSGRSGGSTSAGTDLPTQAVPSQ